MRGIFLLTSLSIASVGLPLSCRAQEAPKQATAVDEIFADLTKPGSPGCAVALARDGRTIYAKGYGLANVEQNLPITTESVFDIASVSKQFTAASILMLEKEGKLSVNDDVRKYIPELPDYGKKITVLHLLNHTSGLRDYLTLFELAGINGDSVTTNEDALAYITRQKALNFDPGTEYLYSNSGFFLLSVIAQRVSGKSLREFAARNIFQPLGMNQTQYRTSHTELIPGRALAYDLTENGAGYALGVSYYEQLGDGAVHTTAGDLLKWDENFYSGQVGGKALLAELQQRGRLSSGKTLNYAKGLGVGSYRGLPTVGHTGSWGGYRAAMVRFPEQHFSVVCLCNRSDARPKLRWQQIADIFLGSLMTEKETKSEDTGEAKARPEIPMSLPELGKFAGDYWSDELGVFYGLQLVKENLTLVSILGWGSIQRSAELQGKSLVPVGGQEFVIPGQSIVLHFQRSTAGIPESFTVDGEDAKGILFQRPQP